MSSNGYANGNKTSVYFGLLVTETRFSYQKQAPSRIKVKQNENYLYD